MEFKNIPIKLLSGKPVSIAIAMKGVEVAFPDDFLKIISSEICICQAHSTTPVGYVKGGIIHPLADYYSILFQFIHFIGWGINAACEKFKNQKLKEDWIANHILSSIDVTCKREDDLTIIEVYTHIISHIR